jgi:AcrR family transcriptional regulator
VLHGPLAAGRLKRDANRHSDRSATPHPERSVTNPTEPAPARAPRADAERNRRLLLDAAQRAFTGHGEQVALERIAKQAGVGIGTLYRHFPTRAALVEAVYRNELARLQERADELLAERPPAEAMRIWMDRFADYVATKRGMADTLRALIAAGTITRSHTRAGLAAAIARMLDAGAAAGTLRNDVEPEDVLSSIVGVFLTTGAPEQRAQASRMLDLLMDGLRAPVGSAS